jgi:hypothetical protein
MRGERRARSGRGSGSGGPALRQSAERHYAGADREEAQEMPPRGDLRTFLCRHLRKRLSEFGRIEHHPRPR